VTDFVKRHPGGSVITYMLEKDATHAYEEFHQRSETADKWLKTLPSRPVDGDDERVERAAIMKDFDALRAELEAEGFFEPSMAHLVWRFVQLAVMSAVGLWLAANGWVVLGVFVLGVMQAQSGWLQHEFGHYSMTGSVFVDQRFHEVMFGVFSSMSASWWRRQHNKHHARPQQLDADVDLFTLPFVAFAKEILPSQQASTWIKYQAFHFFPMLEGLALFWSFYLQPRHALRNGNYLELFYMAINHVYRLALGAAVTGSLVGTLAVYFGIQTVQAIYLFGHFTVSHSHLPVLGPEEHLTWVEHTLHTTMNINPSWWCNWVMGYLNFQIEHHLFPSMPQFRFPQVAPRVRALAAKHNVPYIQDSYLAAFKLTIANLHAVGQTTADEIDAKNASYDLSELKRNLHS